MAETNEIIIRIIDTPSKEEKKKNILSNATGSPKKNRSSSGESSEERELGKSTGRAANAMATHALKKASNQVYSAAINMNANVLDNQLTANTLNNIKSVSNRVLSGGTAIVAGASVAGPVGAIIAGLSAAVTEAINMMQRNIEWNVKQSQNNIQEQNASLRLGKVVTSGGRYFRGGN